MSLPSSGSISASQINLEIGRAAGAQFALGGAEERSLAKVPSGAIGFSDFQGKALREPAQGWLWSNNHTDWRRHKHSGSWGSQLVWKGTFVAHLQYHDVTAIKIGEWTYYRGSFQYSGYDIEHYAMARVRI